MLKRVTPIPILRTVIVILTLYGQVGLETTERLVDTMANAAAALTQICLIVGTVIGGILMPPARGPMLLLPLAGTRQADLINIAINSGARLGGVGRIPGSIVVVGVRHTLLPALTAHGVIAIAAAPALCATRARKEA